MWTFAALLGIGLTAGVTWAASLLFSQPIGLASEPASAVETLAPRTTAATSRTTDTETSSHVATHTTTTVTKTVAPAITQTVTATSTEVATSPAPVLTQTVTASHTTVTPVVKQTATATTSPASRKHVSGTGDGHDDSSGRHTVVRHTSTARQRTRADD
jgi:hypothetical protein